MKSTIFNKILDETTITLKESREEVIEKLIYQSGYCHGYEKLRFYCRDNGKFAVFKESSEYNKYKIHRHYIQGEVIEENGKTVVKIYSVNKRMSKFLYYFYMLISIIYVIGCIAFWIITDVGFTKEFFIGVAVGLFCLSASLFTLVKGNKNDYDIEIMKKEAINRVEAIKSGKYSKRNYNF